jgi:hypothetical protein
MKLVRLHYSLMCRRWCSTLLCVCVCVCVCTLGSSGRHDNAANRYKGKTALMLNACGNRVCTVRCFPSVPHE